MEKATQPVLRAIMESGETWDDPSEDLLFILLEDIRDKARAADLREAHDVLTKWSFELPGWDTATPGQLVKLPD